MSEREKTDRDEIEFDFFDDAPTREAPPREVGPPRRRRRMPRAAPPGGGQGLIRLVVLIAAAILLAVVLVLWVNSCREGKKRDEYRSYMEDVAAITTQSDQVGKELTKLVTTPGIQLSDLRSQLVGLRDQQQQIVGAAQDLQPPGPLRDQQESLVEALQFRVSGLNGLAQGFDRIDEAKDAQAAGALLAGQANRLVASDVVYEDLFKAGSQAVLQDEDVSGVPVPDSRFVTGAGASDLVSAESWKLIVQRLTQPRDGGGLHGNQLVGVRVLPGKQNLSPTEENTIESSENLAFQVLVKNSGDNQETQVAVKLTIQLSPEPIRKEQMIDLVNPGETKTVTFRDINVSGGFGTLVTMKVTVEPVTGEENTSNNSGEYSVIFTLT